MNNYYILGFAAVIVLVLFLLTTGEFKGPVIRPYINTIPSQRGASRGGDKMFIIKNLSVPGWYWDNCCSG